jgi:hypothetical protein
MAKPFSWPLGVFARQQLTLKGTTPDNWRLLARAAFADGDLADACEFAAKAGDEALLDEIETAAREAGDLFAYQAVCRVREKSPDPARLREIAQHAQTRGLEHYAQRARTLLPEEPAS